jgi:mannose-1-phosphate guanylyltransferase
MQALILAAGKGSRLAGASGGVPKPLVPVAGMPVLERSIRWVSAAGVERIWINVHTHADVVRGTIGDGSRFGVPIHYSHEPELLGTAGAWKSLEREWVETSLVVYGDNLMSFDLASFIDTHRAGSAAVTMAVFDPARHAHTSKAGGQATVDADSLVTDFVEGGDAREVNPRINAGAYLLEPSVSALLSPGFLDFGHDVLPRLARMGQLRAHVLEDGAYCLGIDTPGRLRAAERLLGHAPVQT